MPANDEHESFECPTCHQKLVHPPPMHDYMMMVFTKDETSSSSNSEDEGEKEPVQKKEEEKPKARAKTNSRSAVARGRRGSGFKPPRSGNAPYPAKKTRNGKRVPSNDE
jgi:hypothetical protein